MKITLSLLMSLFSMAVFANGAGHSHGHHGGMDRTIAHEGADHSAVLMPILEANDKLFLALLKDDQSEVEKAAKALSEKLTSAGKDGVKAAEHIKPITKTNTKEKNLEHYSAFMTVLVKEFKGAKMKGDYEVYYCPMIKKSWIQNKKTTTGVKNVFSQDMLECGGKES